MTERARKSLLDILNAIAEIEDFAGEVDGLDGYLKNRTVRRAVERMISIIGEATNRFEKEMTGRPIKDKRQIIGLRNRIVHTYDQIDNEIVWSTIQVHLPLLKTEIENLLSKEP